MQTPTLSLAVRSPGLEELIEKARSYIHAAKSPATLRAYRTDFEDFTRFCVEHNLPHLPATPDNRRPLHRRPRELASLGDHHSPADLDHQGSPGGRV